MYNLPTRPHFTLELPFLRYQYQYPVSSILSSIQYPGQYHYPIPDKAKIHVLSIYLANSPNDNDFHGHGHGHRYGYGIYCIVSGRTGTRSRRG